VSLYGVSNSADIDQFLSQFATPESAEALSIFNGLGYVADGTFGHQVVNYIAYDALAVPPTILPRRTRSGTPSRKARSSG
jgi:hypothetical protein